MEVAGERGLTKEGNSLLCCFGNTNGFEVMKLDFAESKETFFEVLTGSASILKRASFSSRSSL